MNILGYEFKKKAAELKRDAETREIIGTELRPVDLYLGVFSPATITGNTVALFNEISEISFPVMAIVNRVCNGRFLLKETKTDGIVYNNDEINKFLSRPNALQTFEEFVKQAIAYKLVTGRSFIYSAMADFVNPAKRWQMCDDYFVLPAHIVNVIYQDRARLFSSRSKSDIIKSYNAIYGMETLTASPDNILHLKDVTLGSGVNHLDGRSRLETLKYPISNLMAVYEARNAIYLKRGAIGAIVSKKTDQSGSVSLTRAEKDQIQKDYIENYGFSASKDTALITNVPIDYIRFNMSIEELMPFEETLADAVQIAGEYNVPAVLIPRKDQATFSNQDAAEKSFYENTIIPEANNFCKALNSFLGLENDGLYLDVSFGHIPVLQPNAEKEAATKKLVSETCKMNFLAGVITLNDWIAAIGGERIGEKIYSKYILQMTEDELVRIERFIK